MSVTGAVSKPPVPRNKPSFSAADHPGIRSSLPGQRSNVCHQTNGLPGNKQLSRCGSMKPVPPPKPVSWQNSNCNSASGRSRPVSCAPSFSTFLAPSSPEMQPELCSASSRGNLSKKDGRPRSIVVVNNTKNDFGRPDSAAAQDLHNTGGNERSGLPAVNEFLNGLPSNAVAPSAQALPKHKVSNAEVAEDRSLSMNAELSDDPFLLSYNKEFESQFHFHREKEFPPPHGFKNYPKTYPSKNPKNPANRRRAVALSRR